MGLNRAQSTRKKNGTTSSLIETLRIFECPSEEVLKNKHSRGPVCKENCLFLEARSKAHPSLNVCIPHKSSVSSGLLQAGNHLIFSEL